mgnify:CR=1 FL=1
MILTFKFIFITMNYIEIIYNFIKDYEDISKCNFYELALAFEYYSAIFIIWIQYIFINKK